MSVMRLLRHGLFCVYVSLLFFGVSFVASAQSGDQFTVGLQVFGTDVTPPSIPTNLVPTLIAAVPQVNLTWNASTDDNGVAYYNIFRDSVLYASSSITSFSDAGVMYNATYRYTVSAVDIADNESARSATSSIQVLFGSGGIPDDEDPPTVPTNLTGSAATGTPQITLTWDASTDARNDVDYYNIYRNGVLIGTAPSTTYVDSTVSLDVVYIYTVSAVDTEDNESDESSPFVIEVSSPPDTTPPSIPTGLAAAVDEDIPLVSLIWNPSTDSGSGVAGYNVFRNGVFLATVGSPSYNDFTVATATSYTYRVSAYDVEGNESNRSAVLNVVVPGTEIPPTVPGNVTAVGNVGVPSVLVSWTASTDSDGSVSGYRIYRDGALLVSIPGLSYTDTTVSLGNTYGYRVLAYDNEGNESSLSSPVFVTLGSVVEPPEEEEEPEDEADPEDSGDGGGDTSPSDGGDSGSGGDGGTSGGTDTEPDEPAPVQQPFIPSEITDAFTDTFDRITDNIVSRISRERLASTTPQQEQRRRIISIGTAVTGVIAPAIEIAVLPAVSGASFWYTLLLRFREFGKLFSWLFPWLGVGRRKKPWGTVYDSVSKQPLDPAYVELLHADTGEVITSAITDLDGRYGFTIPPGKYMLRAQKTNYIFPSKRLLGRAEDAIYEHLYFGDVIAKEVEVEGEEDTIIRDIPMDPEKFDWNEFEKRRLGVMKFYSRYDLVIHYVSAFLFYGGFMFSSVIAYINPSIFNISVLFVYLFVILIRRVIVKPRTKGQIIDEHTGAPLSYAVLKIFVPGQERPTKKIVADQLGRYYALMRPGEYYIVVEEQLEDGGYRPIFQTNTFKADKGLIDKKLII